MKMGWSREALARHIDVSLSSVQRWEFYNVKPSKPAQKELNKLFISEELNDESGK
jgi:ribosome-binding protein aMBF1 (putative translation factor)